MVIALALVDLVWDTHVGLTLTGWAPTAATVAFLSLIGLFYGRVRIVPRLAELATYGALWVAFTVFGCILTYLAASVSRPLEDGLFIAADAAIGFEWIEWANFVRSHVALNALISIVYASLMPQILWSVAFFALAGITGRNGELLQTAIIALLITVLLSALLPALGHGTVYLADLLAVRQGGSLSFSLHQMQGIVSFPSYHMVLAVLFVYAHRGLRCAFPAVAVLNGLMLFSIPSEGGHYMVDVIAGAVVAVLAIGLTRVTTVLTAEQPAFPRTIARAQQ
jgi:hypothetical protein